LERATATQGERVLAEAAEAFRVALGDRLLGANTLGSLAHGGFSELVSDIDLGLIVSDPFRPGDDERRVRRGYRVADRAARVVQTQPGRASSRAIRSGDSWPAWWRWRFLLIQLPSAKPFSEYDCGTRACPTASM
jgi:hypothetical protein